MRQRLSVLSGLLLTSTLVGCCFPVPMCLRHPADRCTPPPYVCVGPPLLNSPGCGFSGRQNAWPITQSYSNAFPATAHGDCSCHGPTDCSCGTGLPAMSVPQHGFSGGMPWTGQADSCGCGESVQHPLMVPPAPAPVPEMSGGMPAWTGELGPEPTVPLPPTDQDPTRVDPIGYQKPAPASQAAADNVRLSGHRVKLRRLQ